MSATSSNSEFATTFEIHAKDTFIYVVEAVGSAAASVITFSVNAVSTVTNLSVSMVAQRKHTMVQKFLATVTFPLIGIGILSSFWSGISYAGWLVPLGFSAWALWFSRDRFSKDSVYHTR